MLPLLQYILYIVIINSIMIKATLFVSQLLLHYYTAQRIPTQKTRQNQNSTRRVSSARYLPVRLPLSAHLNRTATGGHGQLPPPKGRQTDRHCPPRARIGLLDLAKQSPIGREDISASSRSGEAFAWRRRPLAGTGPRPGLSVEFPLPPRAIHPCKTIQPERRGPSRADTG